MNLICNFNVYIKITNLATYVNENFPNIKIFIDVSSGGLSKSALNLGLPCCILRNKLRRSEQALTIDTYWPARLPAFVDASSYVASRSSCHKAHFGTSICRASVLICPHIQGQWTAHQLWPMGSLFLLSWSMIQMLVHLKTSPTLKDRLFKFCRRSFSGHCDVYGSYI